MLAGPSHRILYSNPAFCSAAGRSADALLGMPAGDAFPNLRAPGHLDALDRLRTGGQSRTCRAQALRLPSEDGEPRFWDVEATPLRSGGVVVGLLLQLRDVSAQRRAETALQDALAAQQAIAREAEHRIKNSLQLVASLLRLQASQMAEPAGRSAVEAATARVLAVAEAHRALQRSPDLRKVRVSDLLDELAAGVAVQHPGTDLRTEAAEALTLDAERAIPLALVLAELVEDAVRRAAAAPPTSPAPMRLSAYSDDRAVVLEFLGGGAPAVAGDAAPDLGGTVVRALVRQIGAVLETERLPGGRVRTALSLPVQAAEPAPAQG
ncbi:MAG: PAS domain-containing protein [Acetobacteraceae bacterium]|nr:PAS domain-containing protein [Acetobacteraceae bacterium]